MPAVGAGRPLRVAPHLPLGDDPMIRSRSVFENPFMNRLLKLALLSLATSPMLVQAIAPVRVAGSSADPSARLTYRSGEVIVKYRAGMKGQASDTLRASQGQSAEARYFDGRFERLKLTSVVDVPGALKMLAADPAVEYAEPNFLRRPMAAIPNDPLFAQQWGLRNTGQANFVSGGPAGIAGADMNLVEAWDSLGTGIADRTGRGNVTIAIIDDGFEITHPDLVGNLVNGYDFADNDSDPSPTSADESHGTAVAGAAAASGNNGIGIAGAAWNEKIMPLRFAYDVASELRALDYARNNGARIVNASFGGPSYSLAERDAISVLNNAGILFVTSAGNQDSNIDISGASYPANYQLPNVLAVAATNRQDGVASFSNYGSTTVPVAAPGLQLVTTTLGGGYTTAGINGTSFSSPYVAGVAALIRDYYPSATVAEVKARLIESGQVGLDPSNPVNLRTAAGRIDARQALNLLPRPSLVIRPVQASSYTLAYDTGNVDVPVLVPATVEDGASGNGSLDPGETTTLRVTVENLWLAATNVRATLTASGAGVVVNSGTASLGALGSGVIQPVDFQVRVPSAVSGHQYVQFALAITADGGYTATRRFIMEIGKLSLGTTASQSFAPGLYDEFHTWSFDVTSLPAGSNRLVVQSTAVNDVDIFVRYGEPTQYNVDLGAGVPTTEGDPEPFYFVNVPDTQRGDAAANGDETITIDTPRLGTYYVTVVNFDGIQGASYTLRAALENTPPPPGSGGGGGAMPPVLLVMLLGVVGLRRRKAA